MCMQANREISLHTHTISLIACYANCSWIRKPVRILCLRRGKAKISKCNNEVSMPKRQPSLYLLPIYRPGLLKFKTFAGTPAAVAFVGIFFVMTDPAPIVMLFPNITFSTTHTH